MRCQSLDGTDPGPRRGEPVGCGIPWPRGLVLDARQLVLADADGRPRLAQFRPLDRWPDGSVRWTLVDWLAESPSDAPLRAGPARGPRPEPPSSPLRGAWSEDRRRLHVATGAARFTLKTGKGFPFEAVHVGDAPALDPQRSGFVLEDERGRTFTPHIAALRVEERGPVRIRVRASGRLTAAGIDPFLDFEAHLHFFARSATVRLDLALTNPRAARHPGGRWPLGVRGSVYLRDARFTLALPAGHAPGFVRCSPEPGAPLEACGGTLELYQDSSGGENWQSPSHLNRHRRVPNRFRGYRLRTSHGERAGRRATPVVTLEAGRRHLGAAVPHFWQNCPKALEADGEHITLRLFPRQYADLHELQGGERKTHTFYLAFDWDRVSAEPLAWCRAPLLAHAAPESYAQAQAVPCLVPERDDPHAPYVRLVRLAIEGPERFEQKREIADEYGWRHFGDLYADHEQAYYAGPAPLVSHYNNQYDALKGFAVHFLRSADSRWFRALDELARHVADIDIYHTERDKSTYNHGLFWHTEHYVSADTSTHRSYPALAGVKGGGPSPGHLYTTGLLLNYFLTGRPASREAVLELGDYVIDADDGGKTVFRLLDRGPTGHISASGYDDYHGPGRTPGNALNALVDAHRLSGEARYLDKAEALIRRCIHPADDLEARALHDKENRWFYVIFLCALGKYLDHKAEHEALDGPYAYAQAALLHYARWAAEHEHPYLDKPEILEYPTETWAAQDLRKSDMFEYAARHAPEAERARYLERADFFFRYAVNQLAAMPTRAYCRPLVLMLTHGYSRAWFARYSVEPAPVLENPGADFAKPKGFVPQKQRVKWRCFYLLLTGAILGLAALAIS